MNSMSPSPAAFLQDNNLGSDSDTNPDEEAREYYQPITAFDDDEDDDDSADEHRDRPSSNGHMMCGEPEDGISSISQNGTVDLKSDSESEEEEEEVLESEIRTAFSEDDRRRTAPLSAENAARVMEAMRRVSFPGIAPDWASRVSEDRLIDQIRGLRRPSATSSGAAPGQS